MAYKIAFLDTYYQPVLDSLPKAENYTTHMDNVYGQCFGTADFYSRAFMEMGWVAWDIIGNDTEGRKLWCKEYDLAYIGNKESVKQQLAIKKPDILYCQDLSFFDDETLQGIKRMGIKLASQHSCPWAGDRQVSAFDVVFTSFPHYLERISNLGVKTAFLPIAFGGDYVYEKVKPHMIRPYPVTFVGGINGGRGHWNKGTETLEAIAQAFPDFKWWGYTIGDNIPKALKDSYQGEAWGIKMYEIYSKSKIVFNRHGEVAEGYSNNMRLFEATGMGAAVATESSKNLHEYFHPKGECIAYDNKDDAIEKIQYYLRAPFSLQEMAKSSMMRTYDQHTYQKRLVDVEHVLRRMACSG